MALLPVSEEGKSSRVLYENGKKNDKKGEIVCKNQGAPAENSVCSPLESCSRPQGRPGLANPDRNYVHHRELYLSWHASLCNDGRPCRAVVAKRRLVARVGGRPNSARRVFLYMCALQQPAGLRL